MEGIATKFAEEAPLRRNLILADGAYVRSPPVILNGWLIRIRPVCNPSFSNPVYGESVMFNINLHTWSEIHKDAPVFSATDKKSY